MIVLGSAISKGLPATLSAGDSHSSTALWLSSHDINDQAVNRHSSDVFQGLKCHSLTKVEPTPSSECNCLCPRTSPQQPSIIYAVVSDYHHTRVPFTHLSPTTRPCHLPSSPTPKLSSLAPIKSQTHDPPFPYPTMSFPFSNLCPPLPHFSPSVSFQPPKISSGVHGVQRLLP